MKPEQPGKQTSFTNKMHIDGYGPGRQFAG